MKKIILKLTNNFLYSLNGIRCSFKEFSFSLELVWLFIVMIILYFLQTYSINKVFGLVLAILLLVTEMINTSIEMLCNRITSEFDHQIKKIKDIASGAVFLLVLTNLSYIAYLLLAN